MRIPRGRTDNTHSTEKLYKRWAKQRSILVPERQELHRPCAECAKEQKGCTAPCERYIAWYNATMAAYRRALGMEVRG